MESTIALDIGYTDHYVRPGKGGKEFVKKYMVKPYIGKIKTLENKIIGKDAFHKHLSKTLEGNGYSQELKTWRLWKDSGIRALDLISSENGEIVWNYLNAPSARIYLESHGNNFEEKVFQSYLDVHSKLRNLAKENNNADFLHNDPWLKNYLVDEGEVLPIDAGVKLREDLSVEQLDTCLNRISLYSIAKLNARETNVKKYIEMFRETFTNSEAAKIMDFDSSSSLPLRVYLELRERLVSKIKNRPRIEVDTMSKNFERLKKIYMKNIFE